MAMGNSGGGRSGGGGSTIAARSGGLTSTGGGGSAFSISGSAACSAGTMRTSMGAMSPTTSFAGSTWVNAQPPPTWKKMTSASSARFTVGVSGSLDGPTSASRRGIRGVSWLTANYSPLQRRHRKCHRHCHRNAKDH
ncbi:MAG TPA: hypothetical protein VK362_11810, partial [Reyranella sp.]|nr:hypothetical protein [Reyranella sp.]